MNTTRKKPALGAKGRQWLKSIHLILGAIWLGGGVSMLVLQIAWVPAEQGDVYALNRAVGLINNWIIIPSALLSVVIGVLESWLTPWGFFKHRWVTVKWIVTVAIIVASPLFTSQWENQLDVISRVEGLRSLQNPDYLHYQSLVMMAGAVKLSALVGLIVISILKPWSKRETSRG